MLSILHAILEFLQQNADLVAGVLVASVAGYTGILGFVARKAVTYAVGFLMKFGKKQVEEKIDEGTIEEGDKLEELPPTEEVKQKRKDNLKDLIEGE